MLIKFAYIFLLLLAFQQTSRSQGTLRRNKRHLVFPMSGLFKIIVGIAIPIKLGIKQSLVCGVNFQYQYGAPTNITQLDKPYPPIIAKSRERREAAASTDRGLFYLAVENLLSRNGINGRACVLRGICDNAMHPLQHDANGLYGELLHIALSPMLAGVESGLDPIYSDAQRAGEFGVDCVSLYPECPQGMSIMDMMTVLDN